MDMAVGPEPDRPEPTPLCVDPVHPLDLGVPLETIPTPLARRDPLQAGLLADVVVRVPHRHDADLRRCLRWVPEDRVPVHIAQVEARHSQNLDSVPSLVVRQVLLLEREPRNQVHEVGSDLAEVLDAQVQSSGSVLAVGEPDNHPVDVVFRLEPADHVKGPTAFWCCGCGGRYGCCGCRRGGCFFDHTLPRMLRQKRDRGSRACRPDCPGSGCSRSRITD